MALSLVQTRSSSGNSNAPSITLTSAPVKGNLIAIAFMANDNAGGISISGVPSGFRLVPTNGDVENPGSLHTWVYYKIAGTAESATISVSIDDVRNWVVVAGEYQDSLGGTWAIDQSAQAIGTSATASTGTSPTTTQPNEVWFAPITNRNNTAQSAPTNGFTQRQTLAQGSGPTGLRGGLYDKIVSGTGGATTSCTLNASQPWAGVIAAFYSSPLATDRVSSRGRAIRERMNRVRKLPHSAVRKPTATLTVAYPVNTVAPVVSGTTVVGQTLAVTNGTWVPAATAGYSYQWYRDDHGGGTYTAIPGATANTYLLVDADDVCNIRCVVTAYNVRGSASATSNSLGPISEPIPANTVLPLITGNPQVGSALTATSGTWLHMGGYNPTFTYQWQTGPTAIGPWTNIATATHSFYWPVAGDVGDFLRVVVTATNSGGVVSATSSNVIGAIGTQAVAVVQEVLGCGSYEVVVLTRGGRALVSILPWTQISWGRVLDDTSEATITGSIGQDERCCAALTELKPWRHEIAILRDNVLIWVGPVVQIQTPPGTFQVTARDLSGWWDHRLIHETHNFVQEDLATIFQAFHDDAMAPDTSPGILLNATFSGVVGSKRVLATQHQIAGPVLRDLTNTGIDWTAVGRTILAGGLVVPTDAIGTFVDSHFATPPTPTFSGEQQTNAPTVRGAGGGQSGDRVYATSTDFTSVIADGLLESVESVSTITDYNSAVQAADTQLALRKNVVQVESCQLAPNAPFPLDTLVPGALCHLDLRETCIPVFGVYRLKSLSGSVGSGQDDSVSLVFQPEGTTVAESGGVVTG